MISKAGKQIWNSEAGTGLMEGLLGVKPMTELDFRTVQALKILPTDSNLTPKPTTNLPDANIQ